MWSRLAILAIVIAGCRIGFNARSDRGDAVAASDTSADTNAGAGTLALSVIGNGAIVGNGSIACDGTCTYPIDGPVTLTTVAGEAWSFDHFSAPCGTAASCTVPAGSTITATFVRAPITANRAFLSSTTPTLDATGRTKLDTECQTRAAAGGLSGTFVAMVSTSAGSAVSLLAGSRGWVRLDGLPLVDQPTDLGAIDSPRGILLDELGTPHVLEFVLTGSTSTGSTNTSTCTNMTDPAGSPGLGGYTDAASEWMIGAVTSGCNGHLACFEIGKNVAVSLQPPPYPVGRYVFSIAFTVGGGIAGADLQCQTAATAAQLPGTYAALLATTTQSALDHVGSLAGTWRRPDGIVVTRTGLDHAPFDATLASDTSGPAFANEALFGATGLGALGTTATTCTDWSANGGMGSIVLTWGESPWQQTYSPYVCMGFNVICVQTQ